MKVKTLMLLVSLLCMGMLTSCDNDGMNPEPIPDIQPSPDSNEEPEKPTEFREIVLTPSQNNANLGAQHFAYQMLNKSLEMANGKDTNGNIFISPMGFTNLLTMLANGANEEALAEITNALGADLESLNSFYSLMASALPKADNQVTFSTANSLWADYMFPPRAEYINLLKSEFDADFFVRNLHTTETKNEINEWCSQKTNGMIPEFLKENLTGSMFLANALYFKGKWTKPFDAAKTTKGVFHSSDGSESTVDMMKGRYNASYQKLSGGELISVNYGNTSFTFNIYLPEEGVSIEAALASSDKFMRGTSSTKRCDLTLPKFEVSFRNDGLCEMAQALGISKIFNEEGSPLSKIAEYLYVTKIMQESKLIVSEDGAEAAAVTGAEIVLSAGEFEESVKVTVNRPFVFSITERTNNIILFAGVVRKL